MDINALMQAAQQGDPQAAQFIQQLLAGGGMPPDQGMPPPEQMPPGMPLPAPPQPMPISAGAPLPVFDQAKSTMDALLGSWAPPQQAPPPEAGMPPGAPAGPPQGPPGGMPPPEGGGMPPGMEGLPPDLLAMLQGGMG